jgi:hypothetical protein
MKNKQEGPVYLENGVWYVCVPVRQKALTLNDFACNNYNPYDNLHNMSAEEILEKAEETDWEKLWDDFNNIPSFNRREILCNFINENKKNKELKQEIKLAKKFLESIDDIAI